MEKVNIFERSIRSITDFKFSNQFIKEKTSKSIGLLFFGYLLFVVAICTYVMINVGPFFDDINDGSIEVIDEIPDFIIENGQFAFENNVIYYEKEFEGMMILFDLDNRNTDEYYTNTYSNYILIKENGVYQNNVQLLSFETLQTNLDKSTLYDVAKLLKPMLFIGLGIGVILGIIGLFLLSALVWALTIIINGFIKKDITSGECYKIAVHAMVLPGILMLINWISPIAIPYFFILYLVVAGLYAYKFMDNYNPEEFDLDSIYE
ncbi:MAG: DUF1189 family protein [Clostridiales bacterium]|nr:DUF1189 family protein [Clostridiales bacterium]